MALRSLVRLAVLGALATLVVAVGPAAALPNGAMEDATPLEQAREESGIEDRPQNRFDLPGGALRLSASELLAANRRQLEFSVTLDRAVDDATLELTLPARWLGRAGASDLAFARVPRNGRASSGRADAERGDRVVSFDFTSAKAGDSASFELSDNGIPASTYALPYRWTERGGKAVEGRATVIFYAPVREAQEGANTVFSRLTNPNIELNATDEGGDESETFMTVVPGDEDRFVVGANDDSGGYSAWITNDGGDTFVKATMPPATDAPGEPGPETSDLCCDPMSAADAAGNVWYGGLSQSNGAGNPSRIVINRFAPGETTFQGPTVGLQQRTAGTQDKPMMTIDNSPTSPTFGRLYVVWNEPAGGINIVISQCDTRPGGVLDAANCDDADNWSAPVSVTPSTGSYIYADVAVGPAGQVYVVWWNFSSANAIQGDVCSPPANCASAAGWGTPQTIASLDATGGFAIPFECPILAQPGGRASSSPQVDVDRSGGANNGRVYVSWSDLRADSGTTRCANNVTPAATHLTFDNFVASASGALPGSANPSASVGTRLLTDGEGGGQANSDDWFSWLAVDQTTGQAWADFYSTRDDATRRTTHFYVRGVSPAAGSSHSLSALHRVSGAASNYSTTPCCNFDNDYGDYTGIDATNGIALATWSDKRGLEGEAFVFVEALLLFGDPLTVDDSPAAGGDGDGAVEPGESFRITQRLRNQGVAPATGVTSTLTGSVGTVTLGQATSGYPDIAAGATQANSAPFAGTLSAAAPCGGPLPMSLGVATAQGSFTLPVTVPTGCPPPPPSVAVIKSVDLSRARRTIRVDAKGRFTYTFRASPPNAAGSLTMTTVKAVALVAQKKKAKRKVVVVRKRFRVPASGRVKVRARLGTKSFKLLKRARTLKVRTVVKLGTKRASRRLTLKAPKTQKAKRQKRRR